MGIWTDRYQFCYLKIGVSMHKRKRVYCHLVTKIAGRKLEFSKAVCVVMAVLTLLLS